jgi:hypothetical protein
MISTKGEILQVITFLDITQGNEMIKSKTYKNLKKACISLSHCL